jgi:hypothetical protein
MVIGAKFPSHEFSRIFVYVVLRLIFYIYMLYFKPHQSKSTGDASGVDLEAIRQKAGSF